MMYNRGMLFSAGWILFLGALSLSCSTEIEPTNPYDPESPKELQRRGMIKGRVVLEDISDINRVKIDVSLKDTSYTTVVGKDGRFTLTEIPHGRYTIRVIPNDIGYREVEIGNIDVGIGKVVDIGDVSIFMKKGTIKGTVKRRSVEGKKEAAGFIDVYVLSKGSVSGPVPPVKEEGADRCAGKGKIGGAYSGVTNGDGSFEIRGVKAGSRYVVNPVDKVLGLGYSGEVEIKEDGQSVDVGEIEIVEPSALIQVKDEKGERVIRVTRSQKVMLSYQMAGIIQDVKVVEGEDIDGVNWKMISGGGSDVVELSEGEGEKEFRVKFRDIFCRESPVYSTTVYLDIGRPELVGYDASRIDIDGVIRGMDGRSYVRDKNIKMRIGVYDRYHEYIKDTSGIGVKYGEGDISGKNYETYNREIDYTISEGEGEKEISVQLKDEAGNESEIYKRVVGLDTVRPIGSVEVLNIQEDAGRRFVDTEYVDLKIIGTDDGSGIGGMKIWNEDLSEPDIWANFAENIKWKTSSGDGIKEVKVRLIDNAGNVSDVEIKSAFELITTGKVKGKVYLEGASESPGVNVTLLGTNHTGVTGLDGSFELSGVKGGIYEIVFTKAGYKRYSKPISVKAYYGSDVGEIALTRSRGYIYGNVQIEGSTNNSGAVITLMPGGYVGYSITDGSYKVEDVPVGVYTLEIYKEGYNRYTKSGVEVKEDSGTRIEDVLLKMINAKVLIIDNSANNPFNTKYTKSREVEVRITPPEKYGKVCVAEDVDYESRCKPEDTTNNNFVNFNPALYERFNLSDGDGEKRVYARFLDENNANPLDLMEGVTILDTGVPDVTQVMLNNGAKYVNTYNNTGEVTLLVSGQDTTSGIYQFTYRFEGGQYKVWRDYARESIVNYEPAGIDGEKRVYVRLRDYAGNESDELDINASAVITVDTTEPVGTGISIIPDAVDSNGVKYVRNQVIGISITNGDAVRMRLSESTDFENSGDINISGGIREVSYIVGPSQGVKTVYAKFYDAAGNGLTLPKSDTIVLDTEAPLFTSFVINNGAMYTNSPNVSLGINVSGADEMRIACDGVNYGSWAAYNSLYNCTLSSGDGQKGVRAEFRDIAGNLLRDVGDTIILDTATPTNGVLLINGGADYTNDSNGNVTLTLNAMDSVSGVRDVQIAMDGICDTEGWETFVTSKVVTVNNPQVEGKKTICVRYRDGAGNATDSITSSILLDKSAPLASSVVGCGGKTVCINGDAGYTRSNSVVVGLNISDNYTSQESLLVMLSESASFSGAIWQPYAQSIPFVLSYGDGEKKIYMKVKDLAGNISGGTDSDSIVLDTTAPSSGSVLINSGAEYTNNKDVTLTLTAVNADYMMISNRGDFSGATWETFNSSKNWRLTDGDGAKTVFVKYKDNANNESEVIFDTIVLDTTSPVLTSFVINNDAVYTNSLNVSLSINVSGADEMRIACDGVNYGGWMAYNSVYNCTLSSGDGSKTVRGEFRDLAGNVLSGVSDTITLDRTAPTSPAISIMGYRKDPETGADIMDADVTYKTEVNLSLTAYGATRVAVSGDNTMDCTTATYFGVIFSGNPPTATVNGYQLSGGSGMKIVYACFKDDAGNVTSRVYDTIDLDQQSPSGVNFVIAAGNVYTTSTSVNLTSIVASDNRDSAAKMYMKVSNCGDFGSGAGCNTTAWITPLASTYNNWTLTSGEGQKYVFIKVRDYAGNESNIGIDDIYYDSNAPTGNYLTINGGAAYTTSLTVSLQMSGSDSGSGLSEMKIYNNSDCSGVPAGVQSYSTSISNWNLSAGADGVRNVCIKFIDRAGRESIGVTDSIVYDVTPPSSCNIGLGAGVSNPTDERTIGLNISASDVSSYVDKMIISENATFVGAQWENYATSKVWTLSSGDGEKTIYVKFRDAAGNENSSSCASVNITLDTTAPVGNFAINNGNQYAVSRNVTLTNISATDNLGGQVRMQISNCFDFGSGSGCNTTAWIDLAGSYNWVLTDGDGVKYVYMKFKDNAGNESSTITRSIVLDSTVPSKPTVVINNGDEYTQTDLVTLTLSSNDVLSGVSEMYISRNGLFNDGGWETFSSSKNWDINGSGPNVSEIRYVYVKVRDVAGNESSAGSSSIKVDFNNPVLSSISINSGAATTKNTSVTIRLNANDPSPGQIRYMMISEDPAFAGASWISYVNPVTYTLSSTNGTKTIYARVKDGSGRESGTASNTIVLDNIDPTPILLEIYDSSCTNPIRYTNTTSVCLRLRGEDNVSAGADLLVAFNASATLDCGSASTIYSYNYAGCSQSPCVKSFPWTLPSNDGYKYVSACLKDGAGNYSRYSISNNESLYLDTLPPSAPANIIVIPKSRSAVVSWISSTDTGSGVKNYIVEYSSGGIWKSVQVDGSQTSVTITELTNGLLYTFRVKAVDYANNSSNYATSGTKLIGISKANVFVPESITERIYRPTVSYIEGDLFIVGPGVMKGFASSTLEIYRCPVDRRDCRSDSNWEKMQISMSIGNIINNPRIITDGSYYYIPVIWFLYSWPSNYNYATYYIRCSRSTDCMNPSNWSFYTIESGTTSISNLSDKMMITDGKRLYVSYGYGASARIASCSLYSDCTNSANWSKVTLETMSDNSLPVVANNDRVWVSYADSNSYVKVATCLAYTDCDAAVDWTTYTLYSADRSSLIDLFSSGKDLYMTWSGYRPPSSFAQKFAKCPTSISCDASSDWSIGNARDYTSGGSYYSRIAYSNRKAYIAATGDSTGSLYYMSCEDPDINDCTNANNWLRADAVEYQESIGYPGLVAFDSNVVISIDGPLYRNARLLLPSLISPTNAAAAPSSQAITYLWSPLEYVDGYNNLYDTFPYPTWDYSIFVPEPVSSRNNIVMPDTNYYYTSVNSVRGEETSSDTPIVSVRPFNNGYPGVTNVAPADDNSSLYTSTMANNTLYVTYVSSALGNDYLAFKYCLMTNNCRSSSNWSQEVQINTDTLIRSPQITVTSTAAYISYHNASNNLWIAICNLSTGCDHISEWSKVNISTSVEPSMMYTNNRIAIASRDSGGLLRFHYCYTSSDCTNISNWTRDVQVSTDSSIEGLSLGATLGAFYILKKVSNILKKYYCVYSSGCETTTDWTGMNFITTSSAYQIGKYRNLAARDTTQGYQYATAIIDNTLRVGMCTYPSSWECNRLTNWEFVDLQNISSIYGTDYQVDLAVHRRNIYVTYISSNELKIARCDMNKTNCYSRDNWKISSIYKNPLLRAASSNQLTLSVTSTEDIYQSFVINNSSGLAYGRLYFFYGGRMDPEW